jgi:2-aminoethylphosphonate-pyruvate transaminase
LSGIFEPADVKRDFAAVVDYNQGLGKETEMPPTRSKAPLKLLNPGPVMLTRRVREALLREDICHREPEFSALLAEIRARLISVYPQAASEFVAIVLTGSGTAAVESMVGSLVPKNGHALVVANGVYGERMAAMLQAEQKTVHLARAEWTEPMNLAAAEEMLASGQGITHVVAVHVETTTGRLNDLRALGALCKRYDVPLLLDSVSGFGAEEIDFENWNLEACAGTSYKCLHGAPGASFVLVRKTAFTSRKSGAASFYLNLFRHYAEQQRNSSPFTPAVHTYYALNEALQELTDTGGWRSRRAHYRELTRQIFDGLRKRGVEPLLDLDTPSSSVLTAYRVPRGCDYVSLHDFLKESGFVIYAGQGKFAGEIFRIAVMGALTSIDAERLLTVTEQYLATKSVASRESPTLSLHERKSD